MIEGPPPEALLLFRRACELYEAGQPIEALASVQSAQELAGEGGEFNNSLLREIHEWLEGRSLD